MYQMKPFWVQMIDQDLFFDILRDVAMATDFLKKNGKLLTFVALAFRNGMGYRYLNMQVNSANDACRLYRVTIS